MKLKFIGWVIVLVPALVGCILLVVAWQSSGTIEVIDQSLARHVEQRLIDRATPAIVLNTANVQNLWLWLGGFTLELSALGAGWLLTRPK